MAINFAGVYPASDLREDLDPFIRLYKAGGYSVADTQMVGACTECASERGYAVRLDDEVGYVERQCVACGHVHLMLDSADAQEGAQLESAEFPCGGSVFDVTVGFALRQDGDVRWVSIGLRCRQDGTLGCYADWKIDYSPTRSLRESV